MSRNSKPPFIPPLKLSVSENAVAVRGRPQNVRHAPAADDIPDPQAGGESSRQERTTLSSADKTDEPQGKSTASGRTEELDKQKTAEVQKGAAAVDRGELEHSTTRGDKHVKEAKSRTTSRVRELITQFDRTTSSRSSKLPKRNDKITPRDDSDVETSPPDASDGTDGSISDLLPSEETNESSKMHTRQFQQTEENEMSVEPRQPSATRQPSAKTIHHRSRGAGPKSRLGSVESPSKERRSRSCKGPDSPHGFVSNASGPVRSVAAVETYQVSQQSRLPVFKPETRTQTAREAFAGSQRTSHADYSPRQEHSPTRSTQIRARWDGSPSKGGLSIGAPDESGLSSSRSRPPSDESGRSSSRSRAHRKVMKDVTNPPCDNVTELRCADQTPDGQDPIASFVIHESLLEPPCRATNRPVFEPRGWVIVREERHLSDHQVSNGHSVTVKLRQVLSYLLSLLLAIPVQVFMFAATWIVRLLRCLTVSNWIRVVNDLRSCPLPSEDQTGMWNRIRTGLHNRGRLIIQLLVLILCCYAFLFYDFCCTY